MNPTDQARDQTKIDGNVVATAPAKRIQRLVLIAGLAGIALSYLLGYHGISLTTATDASLMIVGEVIFTSLLAVLVAKERLSTSQGLGIGLGAVGIAVVVLGIAAFFAASLTVRGARGSTLRESAR